MLPYCGDFFVWSRTRSKENLTSSGVRTSPLWKRTPFPDLELPLVVSDNGFQDVAMPGLELELRVPVQQRVEHVDVHEHADPLEVHVGVEGRRVGDQRDGQRVLRLGARGVRRGGEHHEGEDGGQRCPSVHRIVLLVRIVTG